MDTVRTGRCTIGHAAADDVVADVENQPGSDAVRLHGAPQRAAEPRRRARLSRPWSPCEGKPLAVDARDTGFVFILEKALRDHGFGTGRVRAGGGGRLGEPLSDAHRREAPRHAAHATLRGSRAGAGLSRHRPRRGDGARLPGHGGPGQALLAEDNRTHLVDYIRCYITATEWCFAPENRRNCLDILERYNDLTGAAAEETLDSLLHPRHGLYPKAELNIPGIAAALDLRASMGYIASPPPHKYIDVSYHEAAAG